MSDGKSEGVLFKNNNRKNDKHPHARGTATIVCPCCNQASEFWAAAWTNVAKSGKREGEKYQSLAFDPKEQQTSSAPAGDPLDPNEDIPF